MIDDDNFKEYVNSVKELSEKHLSTGQNLIPTLGVWRGNQAFAWVLLPSEDSVMETMLRAATACIVGMGADAITFAVDTYHSHTREKKDGTAWQHNEMQHAREHNTVDADLVFDAVLVRYYDRMGNIATRHLAYNPFPGFAWLPEDKDIDKAQVTAASDDALMRAFTSPTLMEHTGMLAKMEVDLDLEVEARLLSEEPTMNVVDMERWAKENPEASFAHLVSGVVKHVLLPLGCSVLVGSNSDTEREVYVRSLGGIDDVECTEL